MRFSRRGLLGGMPGAALLGCARTRTAWRGDPPETADAIEVALPVYERLDAADGTAVILAARPGASLVGIDLVLDAGARHDPADRPGLAAALGELLPEGTGGTGRAALMAAFGDLGGELHVSSRYDALTIGTRVAAPFAASALALLGDVAQHPTLPTDVWERARASQSHAIAARAPVDTLARHAAVTELTGLDAGRGAGLLTATWSRAIEVEDVRAFLDAALVRKPRAILIAGGIDAEVAPSWIGDAIASLPRLRNASVIESPSPVRERRDAIVLVDRPGDEAAICFAMPAAHVDVPDEIRRDLASRLLTGRLHWELREEQGITYGVQEDTWKTRAGRVHTISLRLRPGDVGRAIGAAMLILRSSQSLSISSEYVQRVRTALLVALMDGFQTTQGLLEGARSLHAHGRPADHYRRLTQSLHDVSGLDVARALRRHFDPRMIQIAVAAPADMARPAIEKAVLAPVRVVSPATLL